MLSSLCWRILGLLIGSTARLRRLAPQEEQVSAAGSQRYPWGGQLPTMLYISAEHVKPPLDGCCAQRQRVVGGQPCGQEGRDRPVAAGLYHRLEGTTSLPADREGDRRSRGGGPATGHDQACERSSPRVLLGRPADPQILEWDVADERSAPGRQQINRAPQKPHRLLLIASVVEYRIHQHPVEAPESLEILVCDAEHVDAQRAGAIADARRPQSLVGDLYSLRREVQAHIARDAFSYVNAEQAHPASDLRDAHSPGDTQLSQHVAAHGPQCAARGGRRSRACVPKIFTGCHEIVEIPYQVLTHAETHVGRRRTARCGTSRTPPLNDRPRSALKASRRYLRRPAAHRTTQNLHERTAILSAQAQQDKGRE